MKYLNISIAVILIVAVFFAVLLFQKIAISIVVTVLSIKWLFDLVQIGNAKD